MPCCTMRIRNVVHKGLRRFIEADDGAGLPAASRDKVRKIVSFLLSMERVEELHAVPAWRAHLLTGEQKGRWSLSVTRNWRITFRVDEGEGVIADLDYEDYH